MNVFKKLWLTIDMLATALTGLAVTVDSVNDQVRQRTGIGTVAEPPLLPSSNGQPEPAPFPSGRKRSKT